MPYPECAPQTWWVMISSSGDLSQCDHRGNTEVAICWILETSWYWKGHNKGIQVLKDLWGYSVTPICKIACFFVFFLFSQSKSVRVPLKHKILSGILKKWLIYAHLPVLLKWKSISSLLFNEKFSRWVSRCLDSSLGSLIIQLSLILRLISSNFCFVTYNVDNVPFTNYLELLTWYSIKARQFFWGITYKI